MVLSSTVRAKGFGVQWLRSVATSAVLLLATGAAMGLVVTGHLPETSSPALFRQTMLVPNLAVVCLRDGCGCDKRPLSWIEDSLKRNTPVLVVFDAGSVSAKELQDFRRALPVGNISFHSTGSASLLRRYAPSGQSTLTLTRFGAVAFQSSDAGPTPNFSGMKGLSR